VHKYRIVVAYDGTDYFGWQALNRQKPSIAQALQDSFFGVFGTKISIGGASRTDGGVHALGQVATFKTALAVPPSSLLRAWSNKLPTDILIRRLELINDAFSVYHNVVQKTYWYHFFLEKPLPIASRYGWHVRHTVDLLKLQECLSVFVGTHDFRSFCSGNDMKFGTIRTIDSATVHYNKRFKVYRIEIKGQKFLRYMIRRIVGACLEVASRDSLSINDLHTALAECNPEQILPKAPAHGLLLYKIQYKSENLL